MAAHFGVEYKGVRLWFDASAAKGMASRRGVGRVKHLRVEVLWLQQAVTTRQLSVHRVKGDDNGADIGTKYLAASRMWHLMGILGIHRREGRSAIALQAASG